MTCTAVAAALCVSVCVCVYVSMSALWLWLWLSTDGRTLHLSAQGSVGVISISTQAHLTDAPHATMDVYSRGATLTATTSDRRATQCLAFEVLQEHRLNDNFSKSTVLYGHAPIDDLLRYHWQVVIRGYLVLHFAPIAHFTMVLP